MQMFSILQHTTAQACLVDITPPVGGVISSLTNNPDGSLKAQWTPANDPASPVSYEVYIQESTATGLFAPANLIGVTRSLALDIYRDKNGDMIEAGRTYHVGIRAIDKVGNQTPTTTSLSIVATGLGFANILTVLSGLALETTAQAIKTKTDNLPASPANEVTVAAIKAKTDQLGFTSGNVNAVAQVVADKTGYSLTPAERTAIAAVVEAALIDDGDGQALINAIVASIGNQNIDQVLLVAAIRADIERVGGMLDGKASQSTLSSLASTVALLETDAAALARANAILAAIGAIPVVTPPTAGQIADAVWDEPLSGHTTPGSTGAKLSEGNPINVGDIADAVWNEPLADHLTAGSTGKKLNDGSALDAQGIRDAVWDAPLADHLDAGTTGLKLSEGTPIDPADIAEAVWDEPIADHLDPGTTGKKLADTFEASGFVPAGQEVEVLIGESPVEVEVQDQNQIEVIIQD